MRIWTIHPKYLDAKGLVALWREALLAQNVLLGNTKGYKNHPQLIRFKEQPSPIQAISTYLHFVCDEADNRGYKFNRTKIYNDRNSTKKISVTSKQLDYEWSHFLNKIKTRDNSLFEKQKNINKIDVHPLFIIIDGNIENWERITP